MEEQQAYLCQTGKSFFWADSTSPFYFKPVVLDYFYGSFL